MAYLSRTAPSTAGFVTQVGHAHLSEFGSVENIAQAKGRWRRSALTELR